jgi:hypothetical protein
VACSLIGTPVLWIAGGPFSSLVVKLSPLLAKAGFFVVIWRYQSRPAGFKGSSFREMHNIDLYI